MLKLIFNEDSTHVIDIENYNQSTILNISNYSMHSTSITLITKASSIANIMAFEDTPIVALKILDEENETLIDLDLTDKNIYLLNYSANIYSGGQNTSVSIGQVVAATEGEGE